MQIPTSRLLAGLALITLSLAACTQYSGLPVRNAGLNSIADYSKAYDENRFEVKWSPDGTMVAVRMLAPDLSLLGAASKGLSKRPQDVLHVFEAETGRLLRAWAPETSAAEATNLDTFRKNSHLNLQWSADSRKIFMLEPKTEAGLLQSLVLFSFDVDAARLSASKADGNTPAFTVRDVVFPESLRKAGALRLSQPSLSPDGTQLALYRESQTSSDKQVEVMTMDLNTGEAKRLGLTHGEPVQPPIWSSKTGQLYVPSGDEAVPATWMQRFSASDTPETLISVSSKNSKFSLSPDERFVLAILSNNDEFLNGVPLHAGLSEHTPESYQGNERPVSYNFVGFLHDLSTGEENYFKSPIFGRYSGAENYVSTEQTAWDYRNTLNYPNNARDGLVRLDPSQKNRTPGVALTLPQNVFKDMIKPFLTDPGNFAFGTRSAQEPLRFEVLAMSPKDSRMVLGGFLAWDIPLERFKLFHIWNPETQKMITLNSSYLDLTDTYAFGGIEPLW